MDCLHPNRTFDTVSNAAALYLSKYCETASGGRVKFVGYHGFTSLTGNAMLRFKCSYCQDNWNVGDINFPDAQTLPAVLTDWVKLHRHVCKKYSGDSLLGKCYSCGWAHDQHDEAKPIFDEKSGVWVLPNGLTVAGQADIPCLGCGVLSRQVMCDVCISAAKEAQKIKARPKEVTGRMFRSAQADAQADAQTDAQKVNGDLCELVTDTDKKTSPDSQS